MTVFSRWRTPAVMIQGTGSDVGKSLIVAGLARAYARRGLAVRPFKPQNMSNNAAVAADGGEIGRAQSLQAMAAGVMPTTDMNPILLKPEAEAGSQVVVQGRVFGRIRARDYYTLKPQLLPRAMESYRRLASEADLVLVEGAGSPAEVNLRAGDIANMGFAHAADLPVVLVADISRGGVIASLIGTVMVADNRERARFAGYIVNKFRGDRSLFDPALQTIRGRIGLDCLGVVSWFQGAHRLPAEDAEALDTPRAVPAVDRHRIHVVVPRLGRIANFDDLDPLSGEAGVRVTILSPGTPLPADADVVLLPGTKSTRADLAELREQGWDIDILAHARRGGVVIGICGGYQMLGRSVADPHGMEGPAGTSSGLGLLDVDTILDREKRTAPVVGTVTAHCGGTGARISGYEIHVGRTDGPDAARPMLDLDGRPDGAVSPSGTVLGTYVHGLFAADAFRAAFLGHLCGGNFATTAHQAAVESTLDALADRLSAELDLDRILAIARAPN